MTLSGIEPAQRLNYCATAVPRTEVYCNQILVYHVLTLSLRVGYLNYERSIYKKRLICTEKHKHWQINAIFVEK